MVGDHRLGPRPGDLRGRRDLGPLGPPRRAGRAADQAPQDRGAAQGPRSSQERRLSRRTHGRRPRLARGAALASCFSILILAACGGEDGDAKQKAGGDRFDAQRAFALIESQVALGQREAGSPESRTLAAQLKRQLPKGRFEPVPGGLRNVVGSLPGSGPPILIAAHYDTEALPVGFVGANDGAAGTAAVVELARTLKRSLPKRHRAIRFALFDGEEEPPGCPPEAFQTCALRGSKAYARRHKGEIGEMILLDYIANQNLRIPREGLSDRGLWAALRAAAGRVGAEAVFPNESAGSVIDDHLPFLQQHVPAIDLIDFSYPHADTLEDTPDKLSAESLDAVGETVAELVVERSKPRP